MISSLSRPIALASLLVPAVLASLAVGCSSAPGESVGQTRSAQLGTPGVVDAADTSCNVSLRSVAPVMAGGAATTSCVTSSGTTTCWQVLGGDVDISSAAVNEGDQPYVLYQSGSDPTWYSAPTTPTTGAGQGFERYSFTLDAHTGVEGEPLPTIQLIPYLATVAGTSLYDHNVSVGNYVLDADNSWDIQYNGDYCYEPPPPATGTLAFAAGFTESLSGSLVQGGKLVVDYDLARMPQCEGVTTDGVEAWATAANARFLPGGETLSAAVNGPYDAATRSWTSLVFERDIPADATSVQLWFETSGDGCQTGWDSDYGQNFVYAISAVSY